MSMIYESNSQFGRRPEPVGEDLTAMVVLVDENDRSLGTMSKMEAHEGGGHLHRAFSIFIFNNAGELLLQQRAFKKYHFGGLWANTCCSHPRPLEGVATAARRRLQEEFGFECDLQELFSFVYHAEDSESGLAEYEYDHVLVGQYNGEFRPNPDEIADWKWAQLDHLVADVARTPENYTPWFKIALGRLGHCKRQDGCGLPVSDEDSRVLAQVQWSTPQS